MLNCYAMLNTRLTEGAVEVTIEIVASSPKALELAQTLQDKSAQSKKYPFDDLNAGQSFRLPLADANVASLRALASRKSRNGKTFKVIVHEIEGLVEVARIS